MQSKIFLDGQGNKIMQEIRIEAHGSGGELGYKNIQHLAGLIEGFKEQKTPRDVSDHFMLVVGYCLCCKNSGFLDEKSADEVMETAAMLAGIEQERAEKGMPGRREQK